MFLLVALATPPMMALDMCWSDRSFLVPASQIWPGLCNTPSSYTDISPTVNLTKHSLGADLLIAVSLRAGCVLISC